MKKILFDIISLQDYHNGGEEYVRLVLNAVLENQNIKIIGLYDSNLKFLENDYDDFKTKFKLVNIREHKISDIINEEKIDVFFIGIGQRYKNVDLSDIKCKTLCVIHDIGDMEYSKNKIHYLFPRSLKRFINLCMDYWIPQCRLSFSKRIKNTYEPLIKFISKPNVEIITVSNYTLNSLKYNFSKLKGKAITVLYPPRKDYIHKNALDCSTLNDFIKLGNPFLLMLNINRINKNSEIVLNTFSRIKSDYPEFRLIVTGASENKEKDGVLYLTYISKSDMETLFKTAWALIYPSYTEGFGYPPVEAMKYGTPVISANVCSMPEILGNAAVYFSPFYEEDLYRAFIALTNNYDNYVSNCEQQALHISEIQLQDFAKLISMIVE